MSNENYNPETPQQAQPAPAYSTGPNYQAAPEPRQGRRPDLPYKVPFVAGLLSGILPGAGQIYVGYYQQGVILAVIFAAIIATLASGNIDGAEPFLGIMLGFGWLYGIIDAARRAQAINRALDGYGSEPVPKDMKLPGSGGSMAGGAVLLIFGAFMLSHTVLGFDLEWLEDWWPLGLMGFGAWLIFKSRQEKAARSKDTSSTI